MKIHRQILDNIYNHAHKDNPVEACGYCGGTDDSITVLYPMTNVDKSPEHFSLDPVEQFTILKKARKQGKKLLACYHSHPLTPARMSQEDIRLANDPELVYIIYSIAFNEVKAFKIEGNKKPIEINLEVIE